MLKQVVAVALGVGLLTMPGARARFPDTKPGPADTADKIIAVLQRTKVEYEKDPQTTPFRELIEDFSKRYRVIFIVNKSAIGEFAAQLDTAKSEKFAATGTDGLSLISFLNAYLRGLSVEGLTYLVRTDHIEITTYAAASKEAGLLEAVEEARTADDRGELVRAKSRLSLPLVSIAGQPLPLSDILRDLSGAYGLNIVVDPTVRDAMKTQISQRLLNVPADTALELLASQAGLAAVRKGNTFRIVSNGGAQ